MIDFVFNLRSISVVAFTGQLCAYSVINFEVYVVHHSSSEVPYTLHVFNGVKWVFRLSLSLPRKIVMIVFMHCMAVVRIKVGYG